MKKFVTLLILTVVATFAFASCDVNDDSTNYTFEFAKIDSVSIPTSFVYGETKEIKVYYNRPTTCHYYDGFYYERDLNTRTVALQMVVLTDQTCEPLENEVLEASFNFYVSGEGPYLFKFFKGTDATGQNTFLEYEIPVVPQ